MQRLIMIFFIITTGIFGYLYFVQLDKTSKEDARILVLEEELKNKKAEIQDYELSTQKLKDEKDTIGGELERLRAEIAKTKKHVQELESHLQQKESQSKTQGVQLDELKDLLTSQQETGDSKEGKDSGLMKGFEEIFGHMADDPEMKEWMRDQQAVYINMIYGDLFNELGLTQDEIKTFKDLLFDKQMAGMEYATSFMKGELDEVKSKEIGEKITQEHEKVNVKIKEFLGDGRFKMYEEYEKTITERMNMNQFEQHLSSSDIHLEKYQKDHLIQAMKEEREKFEFTSDFGNASKMDFSLPSEEKIDNYLREKEQLDSRILERARFILTAEQFEQFRIFQENQMKMQKMGMKMATKMFGSKKEEK